MTNHYNIEITATATHLKATYRDKKFKKLEHLRGKLNKSMMLSLGRIIPVQEDDFTEFILNYTGKVTYTKIIVERSLYSQFLGEWYTFYRTTHRLEPKFTGADGKALKGVISYLKKISTDQAEALATWKLILEKWNTLSDFHKSNTDLKYINSKLNIIINAIKHQNNTNITGADGSIKL